MTTEGYWVYTHTTPEGLVYVGRSGLKDTNKRWQRSSYRTTTLQPYIEKHGWENIKHDMVKDGLTEDESYKLEDELIKTYSEKGICINKFKSGGFKCGGDWNKYKEHNKEKIKKYQDEYRKEHKDELKAYFDRYRELNREKIREKKREAYRRKKEAV